MIRRRRAGAAALWVAVLSAAGCGLVRVDVVGRSLEESYVADANRSSDSWGPNVRISVQIERRLRTSGA